MRTATARLRSRRSMLYRRESCPPWAFGPPMVMKIRKRGARTRACATFHHARGGGFRPWTGGGTLHLLHSDLRLVRICRDFSGCCVERLHAVLVVASGRLVRRGSRVRGYLRDPDKVARPVRSALDVESVL